MMVFEPKDTYIKMYMYFMQGGSVIVYKIYTCFLGNTMLTV